MTFGAGAFICLTSAYTAWLAFEQHTFKIVTMPFSPPFEPDACTNLAKLFEDRLTFPSDSKAKPPPPPSQRLPRTSPSSSKIVSLSLPSDWKGKPPPTDTVGTASDLACVDYSSTSSTPQAKPDLHGWHEDRLSTTRIYFKDSSETYLLIISGLTSLLMMSGRGILGLSASTRHMHHTRVKP